MDCDSEIIALNAETLAIKAVISHVLGRVTMADPRIAAAIRSGFDDAASFIEDVAIQRGMRAALGHTVKALDIVEDLRAATFGNRS
jgi:hypothetical protein